MSAQPIKIGNAGGFWGDAPDAPEHCLKAQPDLDYLTMDYLAELSLSIMALQRDRDPLAGYARDFLDVTRVLARQWRRGSKVRMVTNAGGLSPLSCAEACVARLQEEGCTGIKVGVVSGDDVLSVLKNQRDNPLFRHLETGAALDSVCETLVAANAYLGAELIADALSQGCHLVITGRVADPSLTVGPCMAHFDWAWNDYTRLAGATIAGHVIECGTQVTGGISTHWLEMPDAAHIGFPVIEVYADGHAVVTKPPATGGAVTLETVKEQLLYEIGDPAHYLSPDVSASFLTLSLEQQAKDRVLLCGASGAAPPAHYKVSACYRAGFRAEGQLIVMGRDAELKARRMGEIVLQRVKEAGYILERAFVECLGASVQAQEVVLRVSVAASSKEAVERFTREIAPLVTSGAQGTTGYATGRPKVRPNFGYWPCLIERQSVHPHLTILEVS